LRSDRGRKRNFIPECVPVNCFLKLGLVYNKLFDLLAEGVKKENWLGNKVFEELKQKVPVDKLLGSLAAF